MEGSKPEAWDRERALRLGGGLVLLSAFTALGELVARGLPVFFPGPLCGFLALLVALATKVVKPAWVEDAAALLARHLGLLFLPAAVLATREPSLRGFAAARFVVVCVVAQAALFAIAGALARRLLPAPAEPR